MKKINLFSLKKVILKIFLTMSILFILGIARADCLSDFSSGYAQAQYNHMVVAGYCDHWLETNSSYYHACNYENDTNFNNAVNGLLATFNACCPQC